MTKSNLKNILTAVRDMINRSRIAYKDYLGEETITKTNIIVEGTLVERGTLTLKDSSISSFVAGKSYDVTIDGVTEAMIAYGLDVDVNVKIIVLGNITDISSPQSDGWTVAIGDGTAMCMTLGSYIGKSISISQIKTTTIKKYDIKKVPQELIPDTIVRSADVAKVKKKADDAFNKADDAFNKADDAFNKADNAQTAADKAQAAAKAALNTANNALPLSGGVIQISGGGQFATLSLKEFTGSTGTQKRGIKIGGSGAYGNPILEVTNYDITIYDEVLQRRIGGLNSTELFLKSKNSTKIFKITVDDTGSLSATEVTA